MRLSLTRSWKPLSIGYVWAGMVEPTEEVISFHDHLFNKHFLNWGLRCLAMLAGAQAGFPPRPHFHASSAVRSLVFRDPSVSLLSVLSCSLIVAVNLLYSQVPTLLVSKRKKASPPTSCYGHGFWWQFLVTVLPLAGIWKGSQGDLWRGGTLEEALKTKLYKL